MFYTVVTVSAVSKEELMYLTLYLCVMIDVKLPLWKANLTSQRKHIVVGFFFKNLILLFLFCKIFLLLILPV